MFVDGCLALGDGEVLGDHASNRVLGRGFFQDLDMGELDRWAELYFANVHLDVLEHDFIIGLFSVGE